MTINIQDEPIEDRNDVRKIGKESPAIAAKIHPKDVSTASVIRATLNTVFAGIILQTRWKT